MGEDTADDRDDGAPRGGPALRLLSWLMGTEGKVRPGDRQRAVDALSGRKQSLSDAIHSFAANSDGQQKVIDGLVDVAKTFEVKNPSGADWIWRVALDWLSDPAHTLTWEEESAEATEWWPKVAYQGNNMHVSIIRPDAERCAPVDVSDDDLFA